MVRSSHGARLVLAAAAAGYGALVAAWCVLGMFVSLLACGRENQSPPGACMAFTTAPGLATVLAVAILPPALGVVWAVASRHAALAHAVAASAVVGWAACGGVLLWVTH